MKHFGIKTKRKTLKPIDETLVRFDTGGDEWLYVSKLSGDIELGDGRKCGVKLAVWVLDEMAVPSGDTKPGDYGIHLCMVPDASRLGPKAKKRVADSCGIDPKDVDEYECWRYGFGVAYGRECFDISIGRCEKLEGITGVDDPRVQELVQFAGDVVAPCAVSLVGYTLDLPVNHAGKTGWDAVKDWVE